MRKSLFATTAIVAAFGMGASAANAQDASLDISAFSDFYAAWADQDNALGGFHDSDYDFSTNTEVSFDGQITLDNGITAGLEIELEADNNDGPNSGRDNIDENIVYLEGSFGRVEFGHDDGAVDLLHKGATSVKAVYVGTFNNTTGGLVNFVGSAPVLTNFTDSSDSTKINYFTPRLAGFRIGVTHAPDGNADAVIPSRRATETTDQWEGGIEYLNSFNGFDVGASLTGATENASRSGDNYSGTGGLVVGFGGFEFGTSVGFGEINDQDAFAVDGGIGYSTGPWSVSLTGLYSERDVAGGGEDERYEINSGINYALGPGVSVFASGAVGEGEPAGGANNEYVSLLSGVGVSF